MLRNLMVAGLALGALAACGRTENSRGGPPPPAPPPPPMAAPMAKMAAEATRTLTSAVSEDQPSGGQPPQNDPDKPPQNQNPNQPADSRQIAYTYTYAFAVPTGNLEGLLKAHQTSCENAGPAKCYIVSSNISGLGQDSASGQLVIKGSREWIDSFKKDMGDSLKAFGATLDSNNSTAEDLTVEMIDTTARLNSTKTLRDRLNALLKDRPGKLSDLLEIEQELARVQAEIDSTESVLAAMKLRVAMSTLTLNYQPKYSAVSESIWRPLSDAFSGFLPNVVGSLAAIVEFISGTLLWIVLIVAVVWLGLWRLRRRKPKPAPAASPAKAP